jgi:hypothetical protein
MGIKKLIASIDTSIEISQATYFSGTNFRKEQAAMRFLMLAKTDCNGKDVLPFSFLGVEWN